jgi:hypothetical protein
LADAEEAKAAALLEKGLKTDSASMDAFAEKLEARKGA